MEDVVEANDLATKAEDTIVESLITVIESGTLFADEPRPAWWDHVEQIRRIKARRERRRDQRREQRRRKRQEGVEV